MKAASVRAPIEGGFLSSAACEALFKRVVALTTGGGQTSVSVVTRWTGTTQWLRNRIVVAADTQTIDLVVRRRIRGPSGMSTTTRIDDAGLRDVVRAAERMLTFSMEDPRDVVDPLVDEPILHPVLWSEPTFATPEEMRSRIVRTMLEPIEAAGLFGAGTLAISARGHATMSSDGLFRYYPVTAVECAMTVRDGAGMGSGWGGITHYDLAQIDPVAVAARARAKCQGSLNPRAVEPGRYTVILEPQAVHDLVGPLVERAMSRSSAEMGLSPFAGGSAESASQIGSRVIDPRLTLRADPMDPEAGFLPFDEEDGTPYRAVTWIDRGILKELAYDRWYAARALGEAKSLLNSGNFHLEGAPGTPVSSIDEMIRSTQRGLLVTRFSNVEVVDPLSFVCTGFTRDGLWLIEQGKITMPVKNFRFTDSPMFALNSVEAIGPAARVFSPGHARVVPALKVRDFNFTSLADAV